MFMRQRETTVHIPWLNWCVYTRQRKIAVHIHQTRNISKRVFASLQCPMNWLKNVVSIKKKLKSIFIVCSSGNCKSNSKRSRSALIRPINACCTNTRLILSTRTKHWRRTFRTRTKVKIINDDNNITYTIRYLLFTGHCFGLLHDKMSDSYENTHFVRWHELTRYRKN